MNQKILTNEATLTPPYHAAIDPTTNAIINFTPKSDPSNLSETFYPTIQGPYISIEDINRDQTSALSDQKYWNYGNDPLPSIISGGNLYYTKYQKYKQKYLKLKRTIR
ncbi:MAG: hypothetical protein Harvfovirus56_5 [Harvfovirus sp.]|uniref:Uncharacterized protein n=1 Tax=Harvfovirus sp. TaxID=2487768 RepID=A0A3G5A3C5_9VIRU|nr:MAG: hypothetical protein Harvfovirus56_5 [Harvfovirus sp.]